jgi:tetratricopeptide (TPR) repeat protein
MLRMHHRMAGEHFGETSLERATSAKALGELLKKRGTVPEARELYVLTRTIAAGLGERGVEIGAASVVSEAVIDHEIGNVKKAQADLRSVLALLAGKGLGGSPTAVIATNNLAAMLWAEGKRGEAQEVYQRSLDLLRQRGEQPDQLEMLHNLAAIQHSQGEFAAAEETSAEEVALARRLHGDQHLTLAHALDSYGLVLMARDKPKEAIAAGREAVEIKRALLKPGNASLVASLRKLAAVHIDVSEFADAEPLLRETCEASGKLVPAGEPDFVYSLYQHALSLAEIGNLAEAEVVLRRGLKDSEATLKDGTRTWWMRGAAGCLLAGVVARAAEMSADPADGSRRLVEASALIGEYAERLISHKEGMGRRTRRAVVGRSLEQVVHACEIAARLAPSPEREAAVTAWRARREQFLAEMGGGK